MGKMNWELLLLFKFPRYISKQPYYLLSMTGSEKREVTPLPAKGYLLRVLYAPKLEGTKHPGPPLVSPTGRSKATTTQCPVFGSPLYFRVSLQGFGLFLGSTPSPDVEKNKYHPLGKFL